MLKKIAIPLLVIAVLAAISLPMVRRVSMQRNLAVQSGEQQGQTGSTNPSNNQVKPVPPRRLHASNEPTPINPYLNWILIADGVLNIWLGIRLYKILSSGGYGKSTNWHWVTKDGSHYMDATQRQTGEWKPPTFWRILGYLVLINAIILFIAPICCSLISLAIPLFFNDTYVLAIYSGLLILLTGFMTIIKV